MLSSWPNRYRECVRGRHTVVVAGDLVVAELNGWRSTSAQDWHAMTRHSVGVLRDGRHGQAAHALGAM
jgi:hypothetical protein